MAAKPILQLGDPGLWQRCEPVADPRDVPTTVQDLSDTLAAFRSERGFGRAIAAPQIGVLRRVILVRMPGGFSAALVNPEYASVSPERIELWDDCFSFPDLMVRVSRAAECRVAYTDERGAAHSVDARGDLSELLQHEMDHLDGILAVSRAISSHAFCTRSEWQRQYR
jgi:peptide deformylase